MESRQLWSLRFYGVLLGALSWFLASLTLTVPEGSLLGLLYALLAVGAAIGGVMIIPIKTEWVRWLFNMVVPFPAILVALAAIVGLF